MGPKMSPTTSTLVSSMMTVSPRHCLRTIFFAAASPSTWSVWMIWVLESSEAICSSRLPTESRCPLSTTTTSQGRSPIQRTALSTHLTTSSTYSPATTPMLSSTSSLASMRESTSAGEDTVRQRSCCLSHAVWGRTLGPDGVSSMT